MNFDCQRQWVVIVMSIAEETRKLCLVSIMQFLLQNSPFYTSLPLLELVVHVSNKDSV